MSATVTRPAEFREALRDGVCDIELKYLEFTSPADCINMADYPRHNGMTLRGMGGAFGESQIVRTFDGPPLIHFPSDRHWEIRLGGFVCDGRNRSGLMLQIDYAQQSLFDDVRFENCETPFDITSPASNFDFVQLLYNVNPGIVRRANIVRWTSGLLQAEWGGRSGGLTLIAPEADNAHAACLRVTDLHNEGCKVLVQNYKRGVKYDGGYHLAAQVHFENCGKVTHDMDAGSWIDSEMRLNGKRVNPLKRPSLWQRVFG